MLDAGITSGPRKNKWLLSSHGEILRSFALSALCENLTSYLVLVGRDTATSVGKWLAIFYSQIPGWEKSGYEWSNYWETTYTIFTKERRREQTVWWHATRTFLLTMEKHVAWRDAVRLLNQTLTGQDYGDDIGDNIYKAHTTSGIQQALFIAANLTRQWQSFLQALGWDHANPSASLLSNCH